MKFENDQSESNLCRAFGAVLNTQIKLITNCTVKFDVKDKDNSIIESILVLGKDKIYFYNLIFTKIELEVNFKLIEQVIDEDNKTCLLIVFNEKLKFNKIVIKSIYLSLSSKKTFINYLKCYYSSYYNFSYGLLKDLKVTKEKDIEFKHNKKQLNTKKRRLG